ncbi:MAG TPA: hypothetical protein VMB85_16330 [Bryobacteraceae bacterium]|nr:hypothetical protein [Bryobacteraceae bacterium]
MTQTPRHQRRATKVATSTSTSRRDPAGMPPRFKEIHRSWRRWEEAQFAADLLTARAMLERYPDLVKAKSLPKRFKLAFEAENGAISDHEFVNDDCMAPDFDEKIYAIALKSARKIAADRLAQKQHLPPA